MIGYIEGYMLKNRPYAVMRSYQGYVRCANYFMTLRPVLRRARRLAVPLPVTGRPAR
jgi:hypothetical protein